VLGVLQESPWVAKAFAEQVGTTLPLLADVKHDVARLYGIFDEAKHQAIRTTFTVDQDGIIRAIHQGREALDVDPALEACRVLQRVQSTSGR
jgi:alkyl hydroperoxide reductase subunit AhpC